MIQALSLYWMAIFCLQQSSGRQDIKKKAYLKNTWCTTKDVGAIIYAHAICSAFLYMDCGIIWDMFGLQAKLSQV